MASLYAVVHKADDDLLFMHCSGDYRISNKVRLKKQHFVIRRIYCIRFLSLCSATICLTLVGGLIFHTWGRILQKTSVPLKRRGTGMQPRVFLIWRVALRGGKSEKNEAQCPRRSTDKRTQSDAPVGTSQPPKRRPNREIHAFACEHRVASKRRQHFRGSGPWLQKQAFFLRLSVFLTATFHCTTLSAMARAVMRFLQASKCAPT